MSIILKGVQADFTYLCRENCEKKIKGNIRFVKGVKKIDTSIPEQTVTIVYDPKKTTYQDFVAAFKKIGYTIEQVGRKS